MPDLLELRHGEILLLAELKGQFTDHELVGTRIRLIVVQQLILNSLS
jgi:hypothetical protein